MRNHLFSQKKLREKSGSLLDHFGSLWVILGPFWAFFCNFGSYFGHFGTLWVIFGQNCGKFAESPNFFAGSLGSRYSLLECLQFCSTYNFKQSYEGAMHKGTNNSFLCSHWLLHILAKKEETNQGEAQQVLI